MSGKSDNSVTPMTRALSEYIAAAATRELPPAVLEKTGHHILDSLAAIISGSRLRAGELAINYVKRLGGAAEATLIGSSAVVPVESAALANAMGGHADETDDFASARPLASRLRRRAGGAGGRGIRGPQRRRLPARGGARLRHRHPLQHVARLSEPERRDPLDPHARRELRRGGGRRGAAALRSGQGALRAVLRGAAGVRLSLLVPRQRPCREGVRLRRHGRAQRRRRRDDGGVGHDRRGRAVHRPGQFLRRFCAQGQSGHAHRRARPALRGHGGLDQEVVRRLADPVGARRDAGADRRARREARQRQAHRHHHAGRPHAHRQQRRDAGRLRAASGRDVDRRRHRDLRERARSRPDGRSCRAGGAQECRAGRQFRANGGEARAPGHRRGRARQTAARCATTRWRCAARPTIR